MYITARYCNIPLHPSYVKRCHKNRYRLSETPSKSKGQKEGT